MSTADSVLHVAEPRSGLNARFHLLPDKAPASVRFLRRLLVEPREIAALHAMWTGPEISCPVPTAMVPADASEALPPENATIHPQAGDLVLAYVPARMWGGAPDPVFDLGIFYAHGGRMLFPIGWLAGSVVARVFPEDIDALGVACGAIRRTGACTITFSVAMPTP